MNSIFAKAVAIPHLGSKSILIQWDFVGQFVERRGDTMHVLRSVDSGQPAWVAVTPLAGIPAHFGFFEDASIKAEDLERDANEFYYKLIVIRATGVAGEPPEKFSSSTFGLYSILTPREIRITHSMLIAEYRSMAINRRGEMAGAGLPVVLLSPKNSGTPAPTFDPISSQLHGDSANGGYYEDGFYPGWATWMRINTVAQDLTRVESAGGSVLTTEGTARLLAFPRPKSNQLIVNTHTDDRWAIGAKIIPYYGPRAIVPIAYDVEISRLERTDARYKFPVAVTDYPAFRL